MAKFSDGQRFMRHIQGGILSSSMPHPHTSRVTYHVGKDNVWVHLRLFRTLHNVLVVWLGSIVGSHGCIMNVSLCFMFVSKAKINQSFCVVGWIGWPFEISINVLLKYMRNVKKMDRWPKGLVSPVAHYAIWEPPSGYRVMGWTRTSPWPYGGQGHGVKWVISQKSTSRPPRGYTCAIWKKSSKRLQSYGPDKNIHLGK